MSEQQPLHHATMFNTMTNSRPPDANMMHTQYYQVYLKPPAPYTVIDPSRSHQNPRLDGMGLSQNPAQLQNLPFLYPARAADIQPCAYQPMPQQYIYSYMPTVPEAQLTGPLPQSHPDYTQITMPHQTYFQQIPSHQPVSTQAPVSQRAQLLRTYPKPASRKKCPLLIVDPKTHAEVDYQSSGSGDISTTSSKSSTAAIETSPQLSETAAPEVTNATELRSADVSSPTPLTYVGDSTPLVRETLEIDPIVPESEEIEKNRRVIENGFSEDDKHAPVELIGDTDDDDDDESDDESDHNVEKYVYDRDTLLSFKNCPVSQIPLQDLARLDHLRIKKVQRPMQRTTQRIIRLPTGMAVKRVEGAFVPSSLKKKDGEIDTQKLLSRELNIILNRVSDTNLPETVAELRKLNINSVDGLNMLAKLVFQKAIRQSKYSKVFATLCKDLRTLEVSGSDQFDTLILRQVHELFNTPLDTVIVELNVVIDEKIKNAKDDAIKKMLEEDRETNIIKKKEAYYGNMTLLAQLHLCGLVTLKTMTECLKRLKSSAAPESLSSTLILLEICGQVLDEQAKGAVDQSFARLNVIMNSPETPSHQVYKIQELVDLRDRNWKPLTRVQTTPAPSTLPRRMTEDKTKRPIETKRRTLPNTVTPANLAVTHQSGEPGKLRPSTMYRWTKGSGNMQMSDDSLKPVQKHSLNPNHSREASPRVITSNVWADRQAKQNENYDAVLRRSRPKAYSINDMLGSQDDDPTIKIEECQPEERSVVLHALLEKLMDERDQKRKTAGDFLVRLLEKKLIYSNDLVVCCTRYLATCTEDWLEDYPKGWLYLAQIFERLITKTTQNFDLLFAIFQPLVAVNQAAPLLAHCFSLIANRLGTPYVHDRFRQRGITWVNLGVPASNLQSFLEKHDVSFMISGGDRSASDLQEMTRLAESNSSTFDQFTTYFKNLPSVLPKDFIRCCTKILISKSKNISRTQIDDRVVALGILVNHDPVLESQVLCGLQDCSKTMSTDHWQKSLLNKKVISADAFESWEKSGSGNASITKRLPFQDR